MADQAVALSRYLLGGMHECGVLRAYILKPCSPVALRAYLLKPCSPVALRAYILKPCSPVVQVAAALAELEGYHAVEASLQSKQLLGEARAGLSRMTHISHVRCQGLGSGNRD